LFVVSIEEFSEEIFRMAYAEDEPDEEKKGFMFNGQEMSKVPCFKDSWMYGIGTGMVVGVTYNLALSRNPFKIAFWSYAAVTFGYFGVCRYNYRQREAEMKKIRHAMKQMPFLEGTDKDQRMADEKWAEDAYKKKQTEIRNFRSDVTSEE